MIAKKFLALGAAVIAFSTSAAQAQEPAASDLLLATLWMQRSVEFKANALSIYELGRIRLDQALADKNWTAAPAEQKGDYQNLPPAVVLDIDETAMDNSAYQVWMMEQPGFSTRPGTSSAPPRSRRDPGGGIHQVCRSRAKIFFITNRRQHRKDTRENMAKLGTMGGNVDTFLMQNEAGLGRRQGTRRAVIARDYRILLNFGDNFGDFDDRYRGSDADRLKAFEENKVRWGREWLVIANPTYGSFDTAPFGHDFKKSREEQRKAKWNVLESWSGPKQ